MTRYFRKLHGRGKYHIVYHRSRYSPSLIGNCGHSEYSPFVISGLFVKTEDICKKCLKGPTENIVKIFEGIRVP